MSNETETQNINSSYQRPQVTAGVMQVRLNTEKIYEDLKIFLLGYYEILQMTEDGKQELIKINVGKRKCNSLGAYDILNWIQMTVSASTVQGNFHCDKHGFSQSYDNFIKWFRLDLGQHIVTMADDFEIDEAEISGIIDRIMLLITPYFSRLISNEERKSYSDTVRTVENQQIQSKGGFGLPFK